MRAACLFAWVFAQALPGQTPSPEVRIHSGPYELRGALISVDSNLVEMAATVRDRQGRLIGGLTRGDFELLDNGKPGRITVFSEQRGGRAVTQEAPSQGAPAAAMEEPAPRTIALFFDDMHLAQFGLNQAKIAAHKLVESGLHPGDRLGVFTDSGDVTLDFTADRAALGGAIDRVKFHPQRGASGVAVCPTMTPYQAYVIARHLDRMALDIAVAEKVACDCREDEDCARRVPRAVEEIAADTWDIFQYQSRIPLNVLKIVIRGLSHAVGQRILVMVSPGFVTGGMEAQTAAIAEEALRAHVVISALNSEGLASEAETPEAKATVAHEGWSRRTLELRHSLLTGLMKDATAATGGRFVQNTNDFAGTLSALTMPPEVSYLIAFPPEGEPDNKYHSLKLRLKDEAAYRVESRPGYFSARPGTRDEAAQDRIDRIAASSETLGAFPVTVRVSAPAASTIRVDITVDVRRLKFPRKEGRNVQEFTFVTLIEDADGNFIAGKQSVMDMALSSATLTKLQKDGVHAMTSFVVPKGAYRVREVVREAVENRIAASNTSFDAK